VQPKLSLIWHQCNLDCWTIAVLWTIEQVLMFITCAREPYWSWEVADRMAIQPNWVLQQIHKTCSNYDGLKRRFNNFTKGFELGCTDLIKTWVNIAESLMSQPKLDFSKSYYNFSFWIPQWRRWPQLFMAENHSKRWEVLCFRMGKREILRTFHSDC